MDQIQSRLAQYCTKHENKKVKFVQVNSINSVQEDHLFYCTECINDDLAFKGVDYLLISKIIEHGEKNILQKWPPVSDSSILENLTLQISNQPKSSSIVQQITNYFSDLKSDFLNKVDHCQKRMINRALEMPLGQQEILKKYQEISQINELRELIISGQKESTQKSLLKCKQFISEVESRKETNTQLLQQLLAQSQQKSSLIDFQYPQILKESLLSIVGQINFFLDEKDNSSTNPVNNHHRNLDSCTKIMSLISNKSNYCSDTFLAEMQNKLNALNTFFDSISFDKMHVNNQIPIKFSELSSEQFQNVEKYVDHAIKLQNNEYFTSIQNSQQVDQLSQIIKNKTNFVCSDLKEQITSYLIETSPFLRGSHDQRIIADSQKFNQLKAIPDDFIDDLVGLLQKKEMLKEKDFEESKTFKFYEINQKVLVSSFGNQHEIEFVLKKFPIFDLFGSQVDILKSFQLQKTNYYSGNDRIFIGSNEKSQHVAYLNQSYVGKHKGYNTNCVSECILENDQKYVFRIQIKCSSGHSTIGLMSSKYEDTQEGFLQKLSCRFSLQADKIVYTGGYGIDQHIKGDKLELSNENIIEMRVCLKGQQLEILDYPNYLYKVAINDEYKPNLTTINDLKLYMNLFNEATQYTLLEAYIVSDFQN